MIWSLLKNRSFGPSRRGAPAPASRLDDAEDVFLAEDEHVLPVDLHFASGVLGEEHPVARLHVELADAAVFEHFAVAHGEDDGLDGLFLRGIRDEKTTLGLFLFFHTANSHTVLERSELHRSSFGARRGGHAVRVVTF